MQHHILCLAFFTVIISVFEVFGADGSTVPLVQSSNDPYVMKIYPDGTKLLVRWSEIGKSLDNGVGRGGPPKIVAYNSNTELAAEPSATTPASDKKVFGGEPSYLPYEPGGLRTKSDLSAIALSRETPTNDFVFGPTEGFVFDLALGPSFQSNLSTSGVDGGTPETAEVNFSPGIRFDLVPGYNLNQYVRFELNASFIYNQFHSLSINGETYYASNNFGFSSSGLYQVPIIPSVTFRFPVEKEVTLFLGGGFGANFVYAMLLGELPDSTYLNSNLNSGSSSSWNFAWNLTTGVDWNVMPGLDLNFGYKCLSTLNPVIDAWEGGGAVQGPTQTFFNHTASLGLTWRF